MIIDAPRERKTDYEILEHELQKFFREQVYYPLIEIFESKELLKNESDNNILISAIKSGKIYFYRGSFRGKLTAKISSEIRKLGAKWDRRQGRFNIPLARLPSDIRLAITLSDNNFAQKMSMLDARLKSIGDMQGIADKVELEKFFDMTIYSTDKRIEESLKGITVVPVFTPESRKIISDEYTNNMEKYIKDFLKKEITELRSRIKEHSLQGKRYEHIVKEIQRSYGVSQTKAKFLARQETSLLMSKMREIRYKEAGSDEYIWTCVAGSPNHPVRPMHKELDGTRQKWSDPPVTSPDGRRNHPGEDFNCRCFPRPIVNFSK